MCNRVGHDRWVALDQDAELTRTRVSSGVRETSVHSDAIEHAVAGWQFVGPRRGRHGTGGEYLDVPALEHDEVLTQQAQPMLDASDDVHSVAGDHESQLHWGTRTVTW